MQLQLTEYVSGEYFTLPADRLDPGMGDAAHDLAPTG